EIFFADERAVPVDHPESNYRLVKETLLKSHPEALGQAYRMPADAADRVEAARRYGRRLPDPLDVLVLGMGADGHTASLFPGSAALDESEARVVSVTAPKPPLALDHHARDGRREGPHGRPRPQRNRRPEVGPRPARPPRRLGPRPARGGK